MQTISLFTVIRSTWIICVPTNATGRSQELSPDWYGTSWAWQAQEAQTSHASSMVRVIGFNFKEHIITSRRVGEDDPYPYPYQEIRPESSRARAHGIQP